MPVVQALLCCCDTGGGEGCECLLTSALCTWTGSVTYGAACGYSTFGSFPPFWQNEATILIPGGEFVHTWPDYPNPGCICCEDQFPSSGLTSPVSSSIGAPCTPPPDGGTPLTPNQTAKVNIRKPVLTVDGSTAYWKVTVTPSGPSGLGVTWLLEFRKYGGVCPTGTYELDSPSSTLPSLGALDAGFWGVTGITAGTIVVS